MRQALGLGRVHLFGQSWGSFLALEYAHLKTDGMLFDVPDWEVNGGGVSLRIGARFFPFAGEDP